MSEWSEFLDIVKEGRNDEVLELAKQANVPDSVYKALVGAMTVAQVFLEWEGDIDGGDVPACGLWEGCDEGKAVCPFFDKKTDECGIPNQSFGDVEHAMKIYEAMYERMPPAFKAITHIDVEIPE